MNTEPIKTKSKIGCILTTEMFFFNKSNEIKRKKFLTYFGVNRNTYMGALFLRLYDYYCCGAVNLYKEYKRYYRKEFPSFLRFLMLRFNLSEEEAGLLNNKRSFSKYHYNGAERNIEILIEDETIGQHFFSFFGGNQIED